MTRPVLGRKLCPPPLPALSFTVSAVGAGIEAIWWNAHQASWHKLYRFLVEGGEWLWWSVGLSLVGLILTGSHWVWGVRSRWWSIPGGLIAVLWVGRMTLGLLLILLGWVWKQYGLDMLDELKRSTNKKATRSKRRKG